MSLMERTLVNSSSLASVGYSPEVSTLEIEFHHGASYQYFAVPQHIFDGLLAAASKGAYFNEHIKDRYPFRLLSP